MSDRVYLGTGWYHFIRTNVQEVPAPPDTRSFRVSLFRRNSANFQAFSNNGQTVEGPFCDCYLDDKKLNRCVCGETDTVFDWVWDDKKITSCIELQNNNRDAFFHKEYSGGTGIASGNVAITDNQHYWEIKMISPVYGTDMMVGVGTEGIDTTQHTQIFCSILGSSQESWGLSYTGMFYHKGKSQFYTSRFGQGTIIGVHLDMWNGTLSFYKNRRPLGVAYRGLRGKKLYPMISSTAARSKMRVICSQSFRSSLQYHCVRALRKMTPPEKNVLDVHNVPPGLATFLQNNIYWLLAPTGKDGVPDVMLSSCGLCKKKKCTLKSPFSCVKEDNFAISCSSRDRILESSASYREQYHTEQETPSSSSDSSVGTSGFKNSEHLVCNVNKRKLDSESEISDVEDSVPDIDNSDAKKGKSDSDTSNNV